MNGYFNLLRFGIVLFLFIAFLCMFCWMSSESLIHRMMHKTFETMDAAARQRVRENRKLLTMLEDRGGVLYHIEQRLVYSGMVGRMRWITAERWVLMNLVLCAAAYFLTLLASGEWTLALMIMIAVQMVRYFGECMLMGKNYRAVNDDLLKFLDFLSSYSITSGEVTGIFNQISRYLDEPLKSVLEECYYEAQTSGDTSLALLAMAEKIEHPRFKELVRNIEVSIRYSADFSMLVNSSRRLIREDLRTRQERKTLVNEALINMVILLGMSVVILIMVEQLIGLSIKQILFYSLPGKISLSIILAIFLLFYLKIHKIDQ